MVVRDAGADSLMVNEGGVVEIQTYKKMDWKELGEHPLSTLSRMFGKQYLMSEIGARPDQDTFIELDQIHNFSHLMIEYALANRIVGPLDKISGPTPEGPFPPDLVMDLQKPPGRFRKILSNLSENQSSIDYEETTLASVIARNSSTLKPYEVQLDQLERILKKSSPDQEVGIPRENLSPSLVEQIVGNIYKARHSTERGVNIDHAISNSWALINQRIGGLLTPSRETLALDAEEHRLSIITGYVEKHQGYTQNLITQSELRQQRNDARQEADERKRLELEQLENEKVEEAVAYENAIKVRSGILFPDMSESDRRTALYKKSLLATQTLLMTNYILKNDLAYGNAMIAAYERSINPKSIEQIGEDPVQKPKETNDEVALEPEIEKVRIGKKLEELLFTQISSRGERSTQLLTEFANASSIEYAKLVSLEENRSEEAVDIETTVNTRLTTEQMKGEELSKLEETAQELLSI